MASATPRPQPPATPERSKVLSVRLTHEEFEQLAARATQVGVGPSTLARTLVRSGLHLGADGHGPRDPGAPAVRSSLERSLEDRLLPEPDVATVGHQIADLARRIAALEVRCDDPEPNHAPNHEPNHAPRGGVDAGEVPGRHT